MSDEIEIPEIDDEQTTDEGAKPKASDGLTADLARVRERMHKAEAELEKERKVRQKLERAALSESDKLKAEFEDAKTELEKLRLDNHTLTTAKLRAEIVSEYGLKKTAKFLVGDTEEDLRTKAAELAEIEPSDDSDKQNRKRPTNDAKKVAGKKVVNGDKPTDPLRAAYHRLKYGSDD